MFRPRLALTLGDPRGIGPEIVAKALADERVAEVCDVVVIGPAANFERKADIVVGEWTDDQSAERAGRLAGRAIEQAVALAQHGEVHGIVTAPIDKSALLRGGFDFPGHTEMLAALTGSRVAMMLASDRLRVVLATTHVALRDVPALITVPTIAQAVSITRAYLTKWFGIEHPRVALCALNPHAGDAGRFGTEDDEILKPAAQSSGASGPYPADTVFVRALRGEFDAVVAPYHDVGMTAIKVASFGEAVNVTLGLPFPRTSPDHGTAMDIAGKGIANPESMVRAVLACAAISRTIANPA